MVSTGCPKVDSMQCVNRSVDNVMSVQVKQLRHAQARARALLPYHWRHYLSHIPNVDRGRWRQEDPLVQHLRRVPCRCAGRGRNDKVEVVVVM